MPEASSAAGAANSPAPNHTERLLADVHEQVSVDRKILSVARQRRNAITAAAMRFPGALRVFPSGSVAQGTVIFKVDDADAGVVLDRRRYAELGPDSKLRGGPRAIVKQMAEFVVSELEDSFPGLRYEVSGKRSIKFTFNDPVKDQDPYVDLIVALTRAEGEGIWIPNLHEDSWDASHPEKHTQLLTSDALPKDLRVHRAQVIRLIKACIKQDQFPVLTSFHIGARVLLAVDEVRDRGESIRLVFEQTARDLRQGPTADPAGVSDPIKLDVPLERVLGRLDGLATDMAEAVDGAENEEVAKRALSRVFPEFITPPQSARKESIASELRRGKLGTVAVSALGTGGSAVKGGGRSAGDGSAE